MRIIVVARHFPPSISGGARRPYVLASCLRELGHQTFVIAPSLPEDETGYAVTHPAELRDAVAIHDRPASKDSFWRPMLRNLLLWPDPDRRWANQVVEQSMAAITSFAPDLVITTSPPESIHHIGAIISERLHIKWIGDFRDNWLVNPLRIERQTHWRRIGETHFAKKWLKQMNLACAPTQIILDELKSLSPTTPRYLYPQLALPLPLPKEYDHINVWHDLPSNARRILHLGSFSLSDPDRQIAPTLEKFAIARQQSPHLHLCLAGRLSSEEHNAISTHPHVHWLGVLARETALSLLHEAEALLLVTSPNASATPGKLSEYVLSKRPILVEGNGPWRQNLTIPNEIAFQHLSGDIPLNAGISDYDARNPIDETRRLLDQLERVV